MLGIQSGTSRSQLVKTRSMLQKQILQLKSCGMINNQQFDEHIEQFSNYSPDVHPRIWENIIAEREEEGLLVSGLTFQ